MSYKLFTEEQLEHLKKCEDFYKLMSELGLTHKEEYSLYEIKLNKKPLWWNLVDTCDLGSHAKASQFESE